jgi:hypothetical protein
LLTTLEIEAFRANCGLNPLCLDSLGAVLGF